MFNGISTTNSTASYIKVPAYLGLYRHSRSGRYYAFKKLRGKRLERSLKTTDRKIAERRLREWVRNLAAVDREVEKTTLRELMHKFVAATQGKSRKTQQTNASILLQLERSWPGGLEIEVRQIRSSDLEEWLALQGKRLKNTTYNRYAGLLKQFFDLAARDHVIAQSPFAGVRSGWKKPQEPVRLVPTAKQFNTILAEIRAQKCTRFAAASADFVEFLGLAGLGQAEAASLTWQDVDWELNRLNVRRHKTDTRFHVPLYPDLKRLLMRLQESAGNAPVNSRVFAIKDAKKALHAACERLNYPNFSQRRGRAAPDEGKA